MTKLYEHAADVEIIRALIEDADGELTPETEARLDQAVGSFAEKAEAVALYIRELRRRSDIADQAADEFRARAERLDAQADRLMLYLQQNMERVGTTKIDGELVSVRLQKSPYAVKAVPDVEALYATRPDLVRVVPERREVDRKLILENFKEGRPLPEGIVVGQDTYVRIRV